MPNVLVQFTYSNYCIVLMIIDDSCPFLLYVVPNNRPRQRTRTMRTSAQPAVSTWNESPASMTWPMPLWQARAASYVMTIIIAMDYARSTATMKTDWDTAFAHTLDFVSIFILFLFYSCFISIFLLFSCLLLPFYCHFIAIFLPFIAILFPFIPI